MDDSVTELRDKLTKAKKARDALRNENAMLKQKQGFIGSDLLVSDFESRKVPYSTLLYPALPCPTLTLPFLSPSTTQIFFAYLFYFFLM